jgi:hypothetical protein
MVFGVAGATDFFVSSAGRAGPQPNKEKGPQWPFLFVAISFQPKTKPEAVRVFSCLGLLPGLPLLISRMEECRRNPARPAEDLEQVVAIATHQCSFGRSRSLMVDYGAAMG